MILKEKHAHYTPLAGWVTLLTGTYRWQCQDFGAAYWPQEDIDSAENNRSLQSMWGNVDTANEREATACLEAFSANAELKKLWPSSLEKLPLAWGECTLAAQNDKQQAGRGDVRLPNSVLRRSSCADSKNIDTYLLLVLTWDSEVVRGEQVYMDCLWRDWLCLVSQWGKALVWSVYFLVYLCCNVLTSV